MIEATKNIIKMQTLANEISDSYNPVNLQGRTETELKNFNETIRRINRAMGDVGRFLESNPMFSNF